MGLIPVFIYEFLYIHQNQLKTRKINYIDVISMKKKASKIKNKKEEDMNSWVS